MKTRFAAWMLFPVLALQAQLVEVSSSLPADAFLLYEGIPVRLEVENRGETPLVLGGEEADGDVHLRVRDVRNRVIPRTEQPLLAEPWVIGPGETDAREFDLVQLFHIREPESFRCIPSVVIGEDALNGKPMLFEVRKGTEYDRVKSRKEDRVFSMIGLNRKGRDEVLLRVSNYEETMQLATYFLEKHLRLYPPHLTMNKKGYVATLHYKNPYRVVLCRFNPDGTPINRTFYQATPGVPVRLLETEGEGFVVQGATRVQSSDDAGGGEE